jgi:hypothetical protein
MNVVVLMMILRMVLMIILNRGIKVSIPVPNSLLSR